MGLKVFIERPLISIMTLAVILRFWGIWHGYPFSYYPDELHFINRSLSLGSGDFNPHWFHKPAFLMYLLFFEYGVFFVIGKILGIFSSADGFAIFYFQNPWPFIVIGRVTITLFGIGTVYAVYKMGNRFWSKKTGLYASLILSLCYAHVFSGQDIKADIPTAFFTVLSVYFILASLENPSTKHYLLAGLYGGLGTATKYYAIVLLPCIFLVVLYEIFKKRNIFLFRKYLYSFFSFWIVYFIVSPYNFLDPLGRRTTFGKIIKVLNTVSPIKIDPFKRIEGVPRSSEESVDLATSLFHYLQVLFSDKGVGIIIGALFFLGGCWCLYKISFKIFLLFSFPLLFSCMAIVFQPMYTEPRHQLIIYPFLSIATGVFVSQLLDNWPPYFRVNAAITVLILFIPFTHIVTNNLLIAKVDTRTLAKNWIEKNIPEGSRIMLDAYSPFLQQSKKNFKDMLEKAKKLKKGQFTTHLESYYKYQLLAVKEPSYDIREIRHLWWRDTEISKGEGQALSEYDQDMGNPIKTVGINDYEFYKEKGYEYVVTSDQVYAPYLKPGTKNNINFPSYRNFYQKLFKYGKVIQTFDPAESRRPGPLIKVFNIQ